MRKGFTRARGGPPGALLLMPVFLTACYTSLSDTELPNPYAEYLRCTDQDGDHFFTTCPCVNDSGVLINLGLELDCDDNNAATYPGAEEIDDGLDNNCDGWIATEEADNDNDGYSQLEGDCDDYNAMAYPGAEEDEYPADLNCDGLGYLIDVADPDTYGDVDPASADLVLYGQADSETFLNAAAFVGDLDGDGLPEMAASVTYWYLGTEVSLTYGKNPPLSGTLSFDDAAETYVRGVDLPNANGVPMLHGDINGDGVDDLILGDYAQRRVSVFYGGRRFPLILDAEDADVTFRPLVDGAYPIGLDIAVPGDINQDGYDDLLIGQSAYDYGRGRTQLFYGRDDFDTLVDVGNADASFPGLELGDGMGTSLAGVGDIDKDGFPDFVMGAPYSYLLETTSYGTLYLYYGSSQTLQGVQEVSMAPTRIGGDPADSSAMSGVRVSNADLDLDGAQDLLLGLPHAWDANTQSLGRVQLHYGDGKRLASVLSLPQLSDTRLLPAGMNESVAADVAVADVIGDGFPDILFTCKMSDDPIQGAPIGLGYLAVFEGSPERVAARIASEREGTLISGAYGMMEYVVSVNAEADAHGDGRPDVLVGTNLNANSMSRGVLLRFVGGALP